MEQQEIKISKLLLNDGQLPDIPKNPRFIRDEAFEQLKQSIKDYPDMLAMRELVVVPYNDKYVVLGGNMRLRACRELGYKSLPCKVYPADTDPKVLRHFVLVDNKAYGEDDWDALANEWDEAELAKWGIEVPIFEGEEQTDEQEIERKKREFEERMANGEDLSNDEEYLEWLSKFEAKRTTDDCYTPNVVYDAVAQWVCNEYNVQLKDFERPFYPNGDYKKHIYPKGCVVVDNPPFSILSEILKFYNEKGVRFFLFAPSLTLFSSSSSLCTALPCGVAITYENGANVNTSFLTNLESRDCRLKSVPSLYKVVKEANDENLRTMRKELPKYAYPVELVTSTGIGYLSKYGQEFEVSVRESVPISHLDCQKEQQKAIYGKGYLISEKAAAEKAAAEKAAAHRWELSEREKDIVKKLSK